MEAIMEKIDHQVDVERDFEKLYYSTFPAVAKLVHRWKGSLEDAKDIFHDGLILLYEKESEGACFNISREAYLVGICKNLWIRKFTHDIAKVNLDDVERLIEIPADFYPTVNSQSLLDFLSSTGKKCLDLLQSIYFKASSISKVAKDLGYSNEQSASFQKYKCLEKMRDQIRNKTISYEEFLE